MKRFLGPAMGICILLALAGCEERPAWRAPEAPPLPAAAAVHSPPPAPTPVPENTIRETFRAFEYLDPVTVTVAYDPQGGQNRVEIAQAGEVIQTIAEDDMEWRCASPNLTVEDVNFDGYLDFRFCYATFAGASCWEHVYLYGYDDAESRWLFRKAEELDGLSQLQFDRESETIRAHSSDGMGYAEDTFYKWTGEEIAARRRLVWEYDGGEGVKRCSVWDRAPGCPALPRDGEPEEAWTLVRQWETRGDMEAELAPWRNVDYYEGVEAPEEIPQDLLDFLTPLVAANNWRPFARQYAAGRSMGGGLGQTLSGSILEELWAVTDDGDGLWASEYYSGCYIDIDNDGAEEAFLTVDGGTGHFLSFKLLKQGPERWTVTASGLLGNRTGAYFLSWKGNRYLLVPQSDFDTRRFAGLDVYLFRDGEVVRWAYLARGVSGYSEKDAWAAEGCGRILKDLKRRAADIWTGFDESFVQPVGSAERVEADGEGKPVYLCDLDNDGTEERYRKATISTTTWGRFLDLQFVDEGVLPEDLSPLGNAQIQLLWVDAWPQGNIICTADCWGDGPIRFTAWRWEGALLEKAAELTLEPEHRAELAYYENEPVFDWYWY